MISKIVQYNQENNLFNSGDKIIVGVSGGRDSVCLLHVLNQLREEYSLSLFVVHINHGIRGEEASEDARFVKKSADILELPYYIESINIPEISQRMHLSEEEAGREERYRVMENIRVREGFDKIAVAHHQADVAETVLFHLIRGTGTRGLAGIAPKRGRIIRPILFAEEEDIEEYICFNQLEYRTDSTNTEQRYTRNILRLSVFPMLEEKINKRAKAHMAEAAARIALQNEYIEKEAKKAYLRVVRIEEGEYTYQVEEFETLEKVIRYEIIRRILKKMVPNAKNIEQTHYKMLEQLQAREVGKQIHLPGEVVARRAYESIHYYVPNCEEKGEEEIQIHCIPPCEHIIMFDKKKICIRMEITFEHNCFDENKEKDYTKRIDYGKIKNNVFLRHPLEGDYIVLDREGRRKRLSRYFIDKKIPAEKRSKQLVFADGSHVICILSTGRMSEAFKVTETTEKILNIMIDEERHEG